MNCMHAYKLEHADKVHAIPNHLPLHIVSMDLSWKAGRVASGHHQ